MEEAAWIQKARKGDKASFSELVRLYQAPVYNLAYRMLGERMEAEDAAQEAFIKAYKNLGRFDPERSFRTWLLAIASNHCIDRLRRSRPAVELNEALVGGDAVNPEVAAMRKDSEEQINQLLDNLGPDDRAVVTLRYWYDCSYDEIAEILGATVSSVKSRLHRARRTLAQRMGGVLDGV